MLLTALKKLIRR